MLQAMTSRGRPSLARRRHEVIVGHVRRAGSARVGELAALLDVSEMTVRRDLDALDDAGLVVKVHGGATVRYEQRADEPGFDAKQTLSVAEKGAIAAAAAVLVTAGSAVGLTAGTTTARLAVELLAVPDLTVVTNSIRVANVFDTHDRSDRHVIVVGGERTPSAALVGPVAVAALASFHLDVVFMGVHGMHARAGFTTPNVLEAETNRAFVNSAEQVVVLADHTKWGVTGLRSICPLSAATTVVTDEGLDDDAREVLREHVDRLIVCDPGELVGATA